MTDAQVSPGDIAIVGMAGRFPKSPDVASFWRNLRDGVECIRFFTPEELREAGVAPELARDPSYVPAQGWLDGIDLFDAAFFDIGPREAEVIDPQLRFFLEVAWEALEDAGYDPARPPGKIGVIAGVSNNAYVIDNLIPNPAVIEAQGYVQTALGNHTDFLATRIAYELDLRGPAVTVQTACSTSLVAVHMACQSLLSGESDVVLSGGVCITALKKRGYLHVDGGTNTSDGHVRTFDARADGMLGGNGVGIVVLRRLEDALAAGDTVRAVIKGTAINNDGAHKVSFTAPSIDGQAQVVLDALDVAGVDPRTIGMVEAHGTATPLGDPIEIRALTQAWRTRTDARGFCAIGSAKTNLGHLDIAAGVTGLIKTALSLENREIPPSLHFERPNPEIDFAASPFFVNTKLRPFERGAGPRRAALSSFGMGGTNAHAILEEAPAQLPTGPASTASPARAWQVLTFSAKTESALTALPGRLAAHLEARPLELADVAYTLHLGRAELGVRRTVVARDAADAVRALRALDARSATPVLQAQPRRPVAFLFSGQGAQYANMTRGLYDSEPAFRAEIDRCAELFAPWLENERDLRELFYPPAGSEESAAALLARTQLTQPALFAVEWALAKLWQSFGVEPESMLGHSIGEYVAAALAGVFSLEDACKLVAARGRLIGSLPDGGSMLAVHDEEERVRERLGGSLCIAAVNAPGLVVVSGKSAEVAALEARLDSSGVGTRRLHTSHAFHSSLMDPILDAFRTELRGVALSAPTRPIVSCTTGRLLREAEARDPSYWASHLRQPVRFAAGIETLARDPGRVLLEVGPGETLASLARLSAPTGTVVIASTRHPKDERDDRMVLARALGELWSAGVPVDWDAYHAGLSRRRVPLPTYPFERRRFWIDAPEDGPAPARAHAAARGHGAAAARASDVGDWFHLPVWQRGAPPLAFPLAADPARPWLLFEDESGIARGLAARLRTGGTRVLSVRPGKSFASEGDTFALAPASREDHAALWRTLESRALLPGAIVHLWGVDPTPAAEGMRHATERSFLSLLWLGQELAQRERAAPLPVGIVTSGWCDVLGDRPRAPEKSLVLGPAKSMQAELANVRAKAIDVDPAHLADPAAVAGWIHDELRGDARELRVAFAAGRRWTLTHTPLKVPPAPAQTPRVRAGGTYLFTGGLGGLGLTFAEHLARTARANLVLLGQRELPPRASWDAWLREHPETDPISVRLRGVRRLEELGARVHTAAAAADDRAALERVVADARARFGALHGVVHAAGVVGSGLLATKTQAEAERVLLPKLAGTAVLHELFPDGALDFLLLVSSIATASGVLSGVDYASANAWLDAYAQSRSGGKTFVAAWGWDAWRDVGIAAASNVPPALRERFEASQRLAIAPDEGREAFARLLATDLRHVYVSPLPLAGRDDLAAAAAPAAAGAAERPAGPAREKPSQPRPALSNELVPPASATEVAMAGVWSELLGVAPIGVTDSFFELGGNSLVLMQLNVRLRALFGVSLPIRELFDAPRIALLAERIDSIRAVSGGPAEPVSSEEVEEFTL